MLVSCLHRLTVTAVLGVVLWGPGLATPAQAEALDGGPPALSDGGAAVSAAGRPTMLGTTAIVPAIAMVLDPVGGSGSATPPNFWIALGLNYGVPLGVAMLTGPIAAAFQGNPSASYTVAIPLTVLWVATFGAGYWYLGDSERGLWVSLAETAIVGGAGVLGYGLAVAAFGSGQGTGFVAPLLAGPLVIGALVAVHAWKINDLARLTELRRAEMIGQ